MAVDVATIVIVAVLHSPVVDGIRVIAWVVSHSLPLQLYVLLSYWGCLLNGQKQLYVCVLDVSKMCWMTNFIRFQPKAIYVCIWSIFSGWYVLGSFPSLSLNELSRLYTLCHHKRVLCAYWLILFLVLWNCVGCNGCIKMLGSEFSLRLSLILIYGDRVCTGEPPAKPLSWRIWSQLVHTGAWSSWSIWALRTDRRSSDCLWSSDWTFSRLCFYLHEELWRRCWGLSLTSFSSLHCTVTAGCVDVVLTVCEIPPTTNSHLGWLHLSQQWLQCQVTHADGRCKGRVFIRIFVFVCPLLHKTSQKTLQLV